MAETQDKDVRRIAAYETELEGNPRSLVFITLAEEHNRRGDHERAAQVAKQGLNFHPSSVGGRLALAVAESGRGRFREALEQIKEALIVDQDNPQALALMGSLLLQKGMAKRAIQFLGQAVRLEPESREYADLLKRAKRLSESEEQLELPVMRGEDVPRGASPWTDTDEGATEFLAGGEEATVFASGGKSLATESDPLGKKLAALGGSEVGEPAEPLDRTTYDVRNLLFDGKKAGGPERPKMGGSAADYSRIAKGAPDDDAKGVSAELSMPAGLPEPKEPKENQPTRIERSDPKKSSSKPASIPPPPPVSGAEPAKPPESRRSVPPPPPAPMEDDPTDGPKAAPAADDKAAAREARIAAAKGAKAAGGAEAEKAEAKPANEAAEAAEAADDKAAARDARIAAAKAAKAAKAEAAEAPAADDKAAAREARIAAAKAAKAAKAGSADAKPATPTEDAPKRAEPEESAKKPAKPEPKRPSEDRPATQMVDDAIWALYGGDKPGASKDPVAEPSAAKAKEKDKEPKDAGRAEGLRREVMVVRTSAGMGRLTWWASAIVVAGLSAWGGYAAMSAQRPSSSAGDAEEELRNLGHDLEDGTLASLRTAEESVEALAPSYPELRTVLVAARAEIAARVYSEFGGSGVDLDRAKAELRSIAGAPPTVEAAAAIVLTSSGSIGLEVAQRAVDGVLLRFPGSPKAHVQRARLLEHQGKGDEALAALHTARALNPQRRETLIELARWHAHEGNLESAFGYYGQLIEESPNDIQALLERYSLGQASGRDPEAPSVQGLLFALIKEERKEVAKDEVGRGALLFAIQDFSRGDRDGGLEQLGRAEAAYENSAAFKAAVAGVYLALGQWSRAATMYEAAQKLAPNDRELKIALARARFGLRAGLETGDLKADTPRADGPGAVELPFGWVRLTPLDFALVHVTPRDGVFPPIPTKLLSREELDDALEASSLAELARRSRKAGKLDEALTHIEEARKLVKDPAFDAELGLVMIASERPEDAKSAFESALHGDPESVIARYGLAQLLVAKNKPIDALEILGPVEKSRELLPRALRLLAKLRHDRGDDRGAKEVLARLAEVTSADAAMLLELGAVEHAQREYESALSRYQAALKLSRTLGIAPKKGTKDPRSAVDLYYLGRLTLDEDAKRGAQLLEASLAMGDAPDEAHFYLGRHLLKSPKTKRQGQKELELFKKARPDGELSKEAQRLLRGR
ncbi:MAG: tetratricopeptide repeat protein [Deltaproteobacteria bacterium]|nr:tetratricopeptide repeat protein [Deltaproteobacteria bacterium]